ncbi:hypothetical protein [Sulfurirhabdus autotrophica]|uniref:Uncharacterized protein n=1 Tax=Sulfurirhabdus autotrophica TaxID=1706046 RepID=A0A4R3YB28_9PROT|nr:hypothetical protein [Sulfurirhabdus autotrophica]TCV89635.1 hypothetical protein EDC63_102155 [Sulfurirhabdus autotrophica]
MKQTIKNQVKRVSIALAVMAAFTAFGTGTTQAAATFTRADITLDIAGNLACGFRETGLGTYSQITYDCGAQALGVVSGCYVKNKFVGPTSTAVFHNVTAEESVALLAKNNGTINTTITVAAPESHGGGAICTEPAESRIVAVRWCNASLVDMTNGIVGATSSELFAQLARTGTSVVAVPTCAELQAAPPTP